MGQQKRDLDELPKELTHALSEHLLGGYILLYFDANDTPAARMAFESDKDYLALTRYAEDSLQVIHDKQLDASFSPDSEDSGNLEE